MVNATLEVLTTVNLRLDAIGGGTNHTAPPRGPPRQRRFTGTLADYAAPSRCHGDRLCLRVHAMKPTLPLAPPLADGVVNPCIETAGGGGLVCLPGVHLIGGWHMFAAEALSFLHGIKRLDTSRDGGCFDDWHDGSGGGKWVQQWGSAPAAGTLKVAARHPRARPRLPPCGIACHWT